MFERSQQFRIPEPHEVFTPTQFPLGKENAYAHRGVIEESFKKYLHRGQVPLIFGEYAVGKSTVAQKSIDDMGLASNMIYMPTTAGKTVNDLLISIVEFLGITQTEVTESRTTEGGAGVEFVVKGEVNFTDETSSTHRYVVTSPTDGAVIRFMRDRQVVLVVDELHRAGEEFKLQLADLVKASQGQLSTWPKIVLIGTSSDAASLVKSDPGIDRFVKELRVSPMTDEESRALVTDGFTKLSMRIDESLLGLLVKTAAGAPSLLQSLCLEMAEGCLRREDRVVDFDDYRSAIEAYLDENRQRLSHSYAKVIEHTGPRRYRKQILVAMAHLDTEYPELEDIRIEIEKRIGESVSQTALSGPLRQLKTGSDSVLTDVIKNEGERVHNLSTFRDPMMKSFIRFISEVESQGLLPNAQTLVERGER